MMPAASHERQAIPRLEAVVFDMDGTLLHTLPDLVCCANKAMAEMGFPVHTEDEYREFMGQGGRIMIERAMPGEASADQCNRVFERWRDLYIGSEYARTTPFPGIVDTLVEMRARGVKTAILSNKFHEGVCVLARRHFPGLFDVVRGDMPPAPRKPDPTSLLLMLGELGARPETTAYIGDANVDVRTARNAGVMAIGVSWGYDHADPLRADELDAYAHEPMDLLGLL